MKSDKNNTTNLLIKSQKLRSLEESSDTIERNYMGRGKGGRGIASPQEKKFIIEGSISSSLRLWMQLITHR